MLPACVLASACLGLALLVRPPAASGAEVVDRIAATVNDTAIPESEVRRAMVVSGLEPRRRRDAGGVPRRGSSTP